jgi:hypothetical protein
MEVDFRDRTNEFFSIVHYFSQNEAVTTSTEYSEIRPQVAAPASEITQAASSISLSLSQVDALLAQLRKLSQTQSLFNDPAEEIGRLSGLVRASIKQVETVRSFPPKHTHTYTHTHTIICFINRSHS